MKKKLSCGKLEEKILETKHEKKRNAKINKFFMKYRRGETQCEMKAAKDSETLK
jgi:type I site-specific restriction endonuclease